MKKRKIPKKRIFLGVVIGVLLLGALACFIVIHVIGTLMPSQKEAERWQGESELNYKQISCFIPLDSTVTPEDINTFRVALMGKLKGASLDSVTQETMITDAWSASGKAYVSSSLGKGDVKVTAVGGEFFQFHPIRLMSGNYISASDLMKDRVVLDRETAWLLFGSDTVEGMSMKVNGQNFVVAGVVEREDDFATKKAYSDGMGIFMDYDAYAALSENVSISCYEVVCPDPVKNFAIMAVRDAFPIGRGEILCNTTRFDIMNLLTIAKTFSTRSMQTTGVLFPYWENACRYLEDMAVRYLMLAIAALIFPVAFGLFMLIRYAVRGKNKLEDDIFPMVKDNVEEQLRKAGRKRWEKKHNIKD